MLSACALAAAIADLGGNVELLACGSYYTCAFVPGVGLKCWGSNWKGQLGMGDTKDRSAPPDTGVLSLYS